MNAATSSQSQSDTSSSTRPIAAQSPSTNPGNLILGPHMIVGNSSARVAVGAEAHLHRQPQITIHKQGDTVKFIDVTCACGEKTTIELIY